MNSSLVRRNRKTGFRTSKGRQTDSANQERSISLAHRDSLVVGADVKLRCVFCGPLVQATISTGDFKHVGEGISLYSLHGTLSGPLKARALVYSSYKRPTPHVYTVGVLMSGSVGPFGTAMIQIIFHQDRSSAFTVSEPALCALLRTRSPITSAPDLCNHDMSLWPDVDAITQVGADEAMPKAQLTSPTSSFTTRHRPPRRRAWRPGLDSEWN